MLLLLIAKEGSMNRQTYDKITEIIDYEFDNPNLLEQAFTRRSFAQENRGVEDNEVLEFIGDKALDISVMRILTDKYGEVMDNGYFNSRYREGDLTAIKKRLVERDSLAQCITDMGLQRFLRMGQGDIARNVQNDASVKEDLFEAIIGAITLDCDWDIDVICDVVYDMIDFDTVFYNDNNLTVEEKRSRIVQQWCSRNNIKPVFRIIPRDQFLLEVGISNIIDGLGDRIIGEYVCQLTVDGIDEFSGFGDTKTDARDDAIHEFYEYLKDSGYLDNELGVIYTGSENPVSVLHELYQKGYCDEPIYTFQSVVDDRGKTVWKCKGRVGDIEYSSSATSKRGAKQDVADAILREVLDSITDNV